MRRLGIALLLVSLLVTGCGASLEDDIRTTPKNVPQAKTSGSVELHFALGPTPRVLQGKNQLLLAELSNFIASRKTTVTKWTVYIPDNVPVDTAIALFAEFTKAECTNVAVYAEDARGDCAKRDICVDVGPSGSVQVVTELRQDYPETLKQYVGTHGDKDLLVAKCQLAELSQVLRPLLAMREKKHVRFMEVGGLKGMHGTRYVEVLEALRHLGVEEVSFYGVYAE